ncbi:MAG: SGNH/GDSL hydrolase family protein [Bacteroidales bacterium]|nr:SGNH/GDSL hydrolase family protein [Bacteroidales bacterium]
MKKALIIVLSLLSAASLLAQTGIEASELTLTGKLFSDTPNPYHRVDTARFHGFSNGENFQVRSSSGIAVAFRSDSPYLSISTEYGQKTPQERTSHISAWGYDLYVRSGGRWVYAASGVCEKKDKGEPFTLIKGMDGSMKDFLLYLPTYCEVLSVKIGVKEGSSITPLENPFKHRIGVFGSSYTQGSNTSRGGMTWIAQLARETGFEMLSLGCGGNCRLQDYFCDVMAAADCEAYIFDAFSNPTPEQIEERLFPFIEKLQAAKPGVPLIFLQTIYREGRNFSDRADKKEQEKIDKAEEMMAMALKKYKDVYFLHPVATTPEYAATVDGVHPSNHGYYLWMESVKKPILRILRKYGIR